MDQQLAFQGPTSAVESKTKAPSKLSPLVELADVSVHFAARLGALGSRGSRVTRAVDGVSLSVTKGATVGIVGETGSGKSTIAKLIVGLAKPTLGTVTVAGHDLGALRGRALRAHRRLVQVVFQDPYSSLDPRMTVADIVAEPLTLGYPILRRRRNIRTRVSELLQLVGLSEGSARLYPNQFSGGQRQRIAIARALAFRPHLIVLDEPTSALDVSVRAQILNLLKDLQAELGITYVIISHDLDTVAYMASTVAVMYLGRIVETGPTELVYRSPRHPYTRLLLAAAPTATKDFGQYELATAGELQAQGIPPGCRFHPRCALRATLSQRESIRCETEDPTLRQIENGHRSACHFAETMVGLQ